MNTILPLGFEPGTFHVCGKHDNHFTTGTQNSMWTHVFSEWQLTIVQPLSSLHLPEPTLVRSYVEVVLLYIFDNKHTLSLHIQCILSRVSSWEIINVEYLENERLFPPGSEPGTFRVWGERDNQYTTDTHYKPQSGNTKTVHQPVYKFTTFDGTSFRVAVCEWKWLCRTSFLYILSINYPRTHFRSCFKHTIIWRGYLLSAAQ